jgi:hypothetical protein
MAAKPSPDESEGYRLRDEYKRALGRYIWAKDELIRQRETAHLEDYDKLSRYVDETRAEAIESLRALNRFEAEHPKGRRADS